MKSIINLSLMVGMVSLVFSMLFMPMMAVQAETDPMEQLETVGEESGLPEQDLPELVARIIQWVIGIIGVVLVALFVYGGVVYATSIGNEERVDTGKKIMLYAIIGVVIIAIAFAVSSYVIQALFVN
jgi:Na+-driven multidrug efflux pump